jgi:Ran GTPase-activating protein (RanGAP) involved in mRNA processing and transport
MVNKTNLFPNYRDVLKKLDYCNKKYSLGLTKDRQSRVAQEAFERLGKVLQDRRREDLYETASFYVGKTKDPAKENPELRVSLEKNKNFYARYDDIINEFAKKEEKAQSDDAEEVTSTQVEEQAKDDDEDLLVPLPDEDPKNDTANVSLEDDVMILT